MRSLKQIMIVLIILNVIISIQVHQSIATTQPWQYLITDTPLGTISYSVSNNPLCDVCTKGQFCRIRGNNAICKAYCGDGIVAVGQQQNGYCDDGNMNPMDGCNRCKVTPGWYCENTGLQAGAISTCKRACGDGQLDPEFGQKCDDGNRNTNDGCTSTCQIQRYYQCTTPLKGLSICNPICGDGRRVGIELQGDRCDDYNTFDGDGCNSLCIVEYHYACSGAPSVCKPSCNNGIFNKFAQQQCDNGILTDQNGIQIIDGCDDNCQEIQGWVCEEYQTNNKASVCSAICGDKKINGKETCDDGNFDNGDGCDDKCQVQLGWNCLFVDGTGSTCTPHCGDGRRVGLGAELSQTGCDDANDIQGDGCHNCQTQPHYICTVAIDGVKPQICTNVCGNAKLNLAALQVCDNGQSRLNGNRVVDGCLQDCTVQSGSTCDSINYSISSCAL